MQVSEVMTQISVSGGPDDTLAAAANAMWSQQTGSLLVLEGERLAGIITERDVVRAIAQGRDPATTRVADVMARNVRTIDASWTLHEAARLMAAEWIRHLPVLDDGGQVLGVLSQRDLVGVFAALSDDPQGVRLERDELVRERRLARIEHGDLD